MTDVSSVHEPFTVNDLFCRFRVLIVSQHYVRAFREYLAVLCEFQSRAFERCAYCADNVDTSGRVVYGYHR